MSIREEILKGFLRGIGYMLSTLFVGIIIGLIVWLVFFEGVIPKKECISWNYKNGEKVCAKYVYK